MYSVCTYVRTLYMYMYVVCSLCIYLYSMYVCTHTFMHVHLLTVSCLFFEDCFERKGLAAVNYIFMMFSAYRLSEKCSTLCMKKEWPL